VISAARRRTVSIAVVNPAGVTSTVVAATSEAVVTIAEAAATLARSTDRRSPKAVAAGFAEKSVASNDVPPVGAEPLGRVASQHQGP
jgi:hypothetical protein